MVRIARIEPVHVAQPDGTTKDSDIAFANVGGCNTGGPSARSPASCRCIADQCAMWRWNGPELKSDKRQGFCGLSPLGWERAT